ncbi:hypothetical protein TruAng_004534 [Truncatella angustata]|nr:hypothetical protein TruAng_004534 [Truncatella angustata]
MSSTSAASPIHSTRNLNMYNANADALTATSSATANTPPVVPSKRSDDDIQFISSQPVKKQKLTHTKLQIKITPSAPQYHHDLQEQQHPLPDHHVSRYSPILIPNIQLTPPEQGNDYEKETTTAQPQERRVSTGMVGLPSGFPQTDSAYMMRGVSLPIYTSLQNFVLNQPHDRVRPLSSPPLSPKQLPPMSMMHPNAPPLSNDGPQGRSQPMTPKSSHNTYQTLPQSTTRLNSATVMTRPLTPTSSPSPVQTIRMEKSMSSMPQSSLISATQQYEQSPDRLKQTHAPLPPIPRQHFSNHLAANRLTGPKPPCQACAAQSVVRARAQGLPVPMMEMQRTPTHTTPQMPCPPVQSYPPSRPQFMAMPGFKPGFHPMMMPMHAHNFGGLITPPNNMSIQQHPITPWQKTPVWMSTAQQATTTTKTGTPRQTSPPAPTPQPLSLQNATPVHPALHATHRKPARNLIVDIAETCQEIFPFEDVAKRQDVPVEKVIEVFTAIIGVPLQRSANDRRRPGREATTRIREYQRAKREIQDVTRSDGAEGNKNEIVVRPFDIAQMMGPLNLRQDS